MHGRMVLGVLLLLWSVGATAATAAPPVEDDGAAMCAESKAALSLRPAREAFSAASTNIDVTYYHLSLDVNFLPSYSLAGTVRVEGKVINSPMSALALDLKNNMDVSAVSLAGGGALDFEQVGDVLNITLPAPVAVNGTVAVDVVYGGLPIQTGFGSFVFGIRSGDYYAWSLSEPYGARDWWPCKDHPSDKADSVRVTVRVPSSHRVGSQGILVDETEVGPYKFYDWKSNYPISNYLVSIAVGEYAQHAGFYIRPAPLAALYGPLMLPLAHLMYNDGTSTLPSGWANVTDVLAVFEDWFGPYPFANEKYGHSETTFGGGMEHQTMTSLGGTGVGLVAHELGHQWFGDMISPKTWPHLWLNEGFATYSEMLYFEARENVYPGQFEGLLAARYNSALNAVGTLVLQDTVSVSNMFASSRVYAKGAAVLHMLRNVIGDVAFKNTLQAYATDPAVQYGAANTDDFHRVAEQESGMDLDAFFYQWVTDGFGVPFYLTFSFWQAAIGGGYDVWTTVEQWQTLPYSNIDVFEMPLDIAVQTTGGEERVRFQNDQRHQVFAYHVSNQPISVAIDPDYWILRHPEIQSDVKDTPSLLTIASLAPNPANDRLRVDFTMEREGGVDMEVFDVVGRRVLARSGSASNAGFRTETVDIRPLAAGIYFLRLRSTAGDAVRKFVVVR